MSIEIATDGSKNKTFFYRGPECMERFCEMLNAHKTIFEHKKNVTIIYCRFQSYPEQKIYYVCEKKTIYKDINYTIIKDHYHFTDKKVLLITFVF